MKYSLGRNLVITDREPVTGVEALIIKRGSAFGPTHPTTEMCLTLMERSFSSRAISSILDVGCGTGILALAGLKLGAKQAIALDIAEEAVLSTRENIRRNRLEQRVGLILGSIECIKGKFDLIVANLRYSIIMGMTDGLKELLMDRGALIISGVYDMEFYHLEKAFVNLGFQTGDVLYKDISMADLPPSMSSTFVAAQFFSSRQN